MTALSSSVEVTPTAQQTVRERWGPTSRALRAVTSVIASTLLCRLVMYPTQGRPDVRTDIIGYPIYYAFDNAWYVEVYTRWFVVFPVVAAASYLVLGLIPGFRSGRVPRVLGTGQVAGGRSVVTPDDRPHQLAIWARAVLTAVALGVEAAVIDGGRPAVAVVAVASIVLGSMALAALASWRWGLFPAARWNAHLAAMSTCFAALPVLGLYVVSTRTVLTVASTSDEIDYPWLPLIVPLLFIVGAVVVAAVVLRSVRRSERDVRSVFRLERAAVLYLSGGALIFVLTARLPGSLAPIDAFHEGESLAAVTSLRLHEWPWRDSLGIHGLLGDYLSPLVGMQLFGDSRWAAVAGTLVVLNPAVWVLAWAMWVRFAGRAWPVLVAAGGTIVVGARAPWLGATILGAPWVRFLPVPIILLLLVGCLRRGSVRWAGVTGAALAVGFLVTPEIAVLVLAVGLATLVAELFARIPGARIVGALRLTASMVIGFVGTMAVAMAVLLVFGVLDDYVGYFQTFSGGHALTGAIPITWSEPSVTGFTVLVGPIIALLFGTWVIVRRCRTELPAEDWTMFAVALFNLAYFGLKFLSRGDYGHLMISIGATSGVLAVYVASRVLLVAWDAVRHRLPPSGVVWATAVAAVVGVVAVVAFVESPSPAVDALPVRFRPTVAAPAQHARLGYADDTDPFLIEDVGTVLTEAGLGVHDVYDFTNSPGLFYYLLPYESPTKFVHVSMAIRDRDQQDLIGELERLQPPVVVFNSQWVGQPGWDGIPNQIRHDDVSAWILDHYRPWAWTHGFMFLQRDDLRLAVPAALGTEMGREVQPGHWLGGAPPCSWGQAPSFLDWDVPAAVGAPFDGDAVEDLLTVHGWAVGDGRQPVSVSVIGADGTELGRSAITGSRPDVAIAEGAVGRLSGFSVAVGLTDRDGRTGLSLAIDDDTGARHVTPLTEGHASTDDLTVNVDGISIAPVEGAPMWRVSLSEQERSAADWLVIDATSIDEDRGWYELAPSADFAGAPLVSVDVEASSEERLGVRLESCVGWQGFGRTWYVRTPSADGLGRLRLSSG